MGIKDLNSFLKIWAPEAFRLIEISSFSRKRIAVDATLIMFQSFSAAFTGMIKTEIKDSELLADKIFSRKRDAESGQQYICPRYRKVVKYVFDRINGFVWEMYYHGITPIFVYDGDAIHEKNSFARERRKEARVAMAERIRALKQQILDTPILERGKNQDIVSLRKLLAQAPPVKPYKDFEQIFSHLRDNLGVPVVQAPNEAEKFCAFLAARGVAAASFTTDTDSYVFGAPIVISTIDQETKNAHYNQMVEKTAEENERSGDSVFVTRRQCSTHFSAVVTPLITQQLGVTHKQFVDLCIMLGCDFNSRIPGVGPAKSWKLIQKAKENSQSERLIEKIAEDNPNFDWQLLCSERCREIFTHMKDCEDRLEEMFRKSPDRAIFNVDGKRVTNKDIKNCYIRYFLPKLDPTTQAPEEVEYYTN